ncbi:MAG TPA: TolC family protein [Ferruginibacter sp.]|nr:TolC family protein [Ferruginibacter sp.]HMP21705.1 TolC family protein [Ferruginibacter sp.]
MKHCKIFIVLFFPSLLAAQAPILTLQQAIQEAMKNNFDVIITKNTAEISQINNKWANAGLMPTVSITANKLLGTNNIEQNLVNGTEIKTSGASVNNLNAGLAASWRFFDGMAMFATKKRLEEIEKTGMYTFTKTANETIYNVTTAYYDIVRLQQQVKAIKEVITLYEERLKIAEARFNIGSSPKTDMLQAKVDLNEQQTNLTTAENAISLGKVTLNNLLARDPATVFETADSFVLNRQVNYLLLQQKLEQQNPDVLIAKSNIAIMLQTKKELNAQRLPTATLNGNYNFVRNRNAAGFTLLNQTYGPSASVGIVIPIFIGGLVKQQLRAADLNIKNQELASSQVKNQVLSAFTNAYLNYNNGLKLAEMEKNNLELVKENNMINLERFKKLSITSVELRQGQINYTDAQYRLINAQYQSKIAEAEMLLLAGEIAD